MNPKKANRLYKEVAEELNISDTLVEETISFYYNHIRQMLSGLTDPRINVEGLGHFIIKTNLVKKTIPRIEKGLDAHDVSTFSAYFGKKNKEVKLGQLKILQEKILIEEDRKAKHKIKRNEYIENNLEGKTQDS
jgi:hypothetical protein